jgi:NADPH:quinone reductase-like Zn-dependent oxidoreductase
VRAIVIAPDQPDRIAFADVPEPVPAADEVVIDVRAVSLNRGEYRRLRQMAAGTIVGYDPAGVVAVEAADGSGPPTGTRVIGVIPNGSWAERVAVPSRVVAEIPDGLSFEKASTVPVAGMTSLAALAHGSPLLGKRALITGAAGGVGRFAVQLARLQGAHVTALVGGPDRAAGLREIGASEVVTRLEPDDEPFDLILESVGGEVLTAALPLIAQRGTMVIIGGSSDTPSTFDGLVFARKGPITIHGMSLFLEMERQGMDRREMRWLLELVDAGRLDPQIDRVASWREMGSLLAALGERHINGKAVAVID